MNNDETGEVSGMEIENALKGLSIPFYKLDISGQHLKDANEALNPNRERFKAVIEKD